MTMASAQAPAYVSAPFPPDEAHRLQALEQYKLVGIGREPAFDRVARLAADLFDVPMALVSIVGSDMQCFRGACGMDATGTPRDVAFCAFAILGTNVMVVPDATKDPRFVNNPLVTGDPYVRFYAGAPLRVADGQALGTLCLIGQEPREFGPEDRRRLAQMADTVVDLIELRVEHFAADDHRRRLADERALLKLTVENVSEGVVLVDGNLRLILWNEAFLDLFGYQPNGVHEGDDATALILRTAELGELGPGDPRAIVDAFIASIRSAPSRHLEIERKDGRILEIRRKSITGGRFIMTARDVTRERALAGMKDELVSTVSHELRTPVTAIGGALGLMAGGAAGEMPARAAGLIDIAHRNSERLVALVNDLLDMDKLQSGKASFQFAPTDLAALLAETAEQNQPFADRFGVSVVLETIDPLTVRLDVDRITQVMTNLISNACKFSPPGSTVRITLDRAGGEAVVRVADQGPGISPEFRSRLFSRFAQERDSHQHGQPGTGLGLAISKSIVEAHGGTIALDADVAIGATFEMRLPIDGPV